jgi:hypothetical protein
MHRPKIAITKAFQTDEKGHFRYYSALYNPESPEIKPKAPVFDLDDKPSRFPHMIVNTEKELIKFVYDNYGIGFYRIIGYIKKRKGNWTFWRGEITRDGFIFAKKETSEQREIEKLKRELDEAETEHERQSIQDMIELDLEIMKLEKDTTKFGFTPFLKPSGRRGQFVFWDDPDEAYIKKEKEIINKEEDYSKW